MDVIAGDGWLLKGDDVESLDGECVDNAKEKTILFFSSLEID